MDLEANLTFQTIEVDFMVQKDFMFVLKLISRALIFISRFRIFISRLRITTIGPISKMKMNFRRPT